MTHKSAHIIKRICFPKSSETQELYIRWNRSNQHTEKMLDPSLSAGDTISLNTYFNSFYEKHYAQYTHLESLHL